MPGEVLKLFFWRGVRPEVWNPNPYLRIFLTPKMADYIRQYFKIFANSDSYLRVFVPEKRLTLTLLHITKPHKNYLQNTQHVVLRNHPTLSMGTERLACLNNPHGVQLGTLAGLEPQAWRARCACFFSPPSLPSSFERFFFSHLPHQTHESVRVIIYYWLGVLLALTLLHITKPNKNYLQNMQHVVLRNRPTLSIGTERLVCLNNPRGVQLGTLA